MKTTVNGATTPVSARARLIVRQRRRAQSSIHIPVVGEGPNASVAEVGSIQEPLSPKGDIPAAAALAKKCANTPPLGHEKQLPQADWLRRGQARITARTSYIQTAHQSTDTKDAAAYPPAEQQLAKRAENPHQLSVHQAATAEIREQMVNSRAQEQVTGVPPAFTTPSTRSAANGQSCLAGASSDLAGARQPAPNATSAPEISGGDNNGSALVCQREAVERLTGEQSNHGVPTDLKKRLVFCPEPKAAVNRSPVLPSVAPAKEAWPADCQVPPSEESSASQVATPTRKTGLPAHSIIRHRRRSTLPLITPGIGQESDMAAVELKNLQEKFKGTTPQEREILRKLGFRLEQALRELRQATIQERAQET